ncbi:unnamed protein product [Triticum turgidum subsp. durum]|uniref:F-box domain-containing protein n=1 Tax=Triticum turgidum subsp. durum TaxID=4567 RepID=A0A9R0XM50_TRITD|nr:unnamed protein product [Triticum turgidum subsp. durum]
MAAPPPPALPDELVQEILARLPPDDPACLLRAFLVCKAWGCAVSLPSFRRRLHDLHRPPPLLGFLPNWASEGTPSFIPTTASSFSLGAPDCLRWRALDCRHGRALFFSVNQDARTLLVWEPITGARKRFPVPAAFEITYAAEFPSNRPIAAVLCAADGCEHRDCFGGPFRVVFLFEDDTAEEEQNCVIWACEYSSETGAWGELTSLHTKFFKEVTENSSVLLGRSLYFVATKSILEYDLEGHAMTLFSPPDNCDCLHLNLMLTEDGGLGAIVQDFGTCLELWTREVSDSTDTRWVLSRVMDLRNLLPTSTRLNRGFTVRVMGFIEGANIIFVNSEVAGIFTIELRSEQVRKVCDDCGFGGLVPVVTYTPVPQGYHQNLLVSKPSEEAGGEEGGEGKKTVDQAQQLFDKGSNSINAGDLVNTFESISLDHGIRVPGYGEVAPACASIFDKYGCAYKAQKVNDSLYSVPKSAPNEELVKGTTSEDDAGDSMTSGSKC